MPRLFKAIVVAVLVFCAVLAVFIGTWLDVATIHVIAGIAIGVLVAVPLAVCLTTLSLHRRHESTVPVQAISPQYFFPPTVCGTPDTKAPATSRRELNQPYSFPLKRHFYLIREDGVPTEIQPEDSMAQEETNYVR